MPSPAARRDEATVRYVVLLHTDDRGTHYDLMIDQEGGLATWKCQRPPEQSGEKGQACTRIGDHRRAYLDYEGPISGGRGSVTRHDAGVCRLRLQEESLWKVEFRGDLLRGGYALVRSRDAALAETEAGFQSWSLRAQ